jgi:hypothetical protein
VYGRQNWEEVIMAFDKDELSKIKSKEAGWKADAEVKEAKRAAQERAVDAYNQSASNIMAGKSNPKTSDAINMETYSPDLRKGSKNFPSTTKDFAEKGGAAIEAADQEKSREEGRSPRSATMLESLGLKKGGKVSSASKRADGCCIRGKTRA